MLNILLFGPPGVGKGTQSERLTQKYALVHLSTGDIFRANIKENTSLGQLAKSFMDKGELVPDAVTIGMLESEVKKYPQAKGFIFDGFPRTIEQAKALNVFLDSLNTEIKQMIALKVSENELVKRLLLRGKESGRADDQNEEIIKSRIEVYNKQTAVVADFYEGLSKYREVDGVGTIDEISERLYAIVDTLVK
jgi:adenylate kinase